MAAETGQLQCTNCGAALRRGASFCSKCGTRYSRAGDTTPVNESPAVSDAWLKADIVSPASAAPSESTEFQETIADAAIADDDDGLETRLSMPDAPRSNVVPIREGIAEPELEPKLEPEPEPESEPETVIAPGQAVRAKPLPEAPEAPKKPAPVPANTAAMRNRPKLPREKIEMVWERPDDGINVWFIVGSLVVVALVIAVIAAAWMVR